MKKIITALILAVSLVSSCLIMTACSEVEDGSKIQRMKITFEFYDASNVVVDTEDVFVKLYLNYAPDSTEFFMKLCEDGFYNNTCISNVNASWCEFGEYEYTSDSQLRRKPNNYNSIRGEFLKNGIKGNKLTSQAGALIMKREYNSDDGSSRYNTSNGTMILTFASTNQFSPDEYCYIGLVEKSDASSSYSSVSTSSSYVNRNGMSSLDKILTISDYYQTSDKVITFYNNIKENYITLKYDEDNEPHYYNGTDISKANEIVDDDLIDLKKDMKDNAYNYYAIPYTKVVIKNICKVSK